MLVNDGHWPATCLSLFDCQKEPAIGFHQGLKPLCSSPCYLTSKPVNSVIRCASKSSVRNVSSIRREEVFLFFSFSLSLSPFFSFFSWLNIFRWLSQGQEVESVATVRKGNCCLLWSEFHIVLCRSERLCQLGSRPVLHILSAFGHWSKGLEASPVVPGVTWQGETFMLVFMECYKGWGR